MTGLTVSHPLRRVESALNAHPTAAFFTLTVSISWGLWIPLFVAFPSATSLVMIPGAFGPALAAVAVRGVRGKSVRTWVVDVFLLIRSVTPSSRSGTEPIRHRTQASEAVI